jgi:hypothetical protein
MPRIVECESLSSADLIIDAIYEGRDSQLASDPISRLLPGCGNMGGFRLAGKGQDKLFVALFTTGQEKDWPDRVDLNTGQFTYYGDNRTPGHELHDTPLGGNRVLRRVFDLLHGSPPQRGLIPPFFTIPEQMPDNDNKSAILQAVYEHFKDSPHQFEGFAARIFQMHDRRVIIDRLTRASIDGGRDAIGRYVLGLSHDPVYVDFALEDKCYSGDQSLRPMR